MEPGAEVEAVGEARVVVLMAEVQEVAESAAASREAVEKVVEVVVVGVKAGMRVVVLLAMEQMVVNFASPLGRWLLYRSA